MLARIIFPVTIALAAAGCAAVQPVSPGGPARYLPAYPVMLIEKEQRKDIAAAAWIRLIRQQGISSNPPLALQPITATIERLPDGLSGTLRLPKVGTSDQMSAEETRESLRRFLAEWKPLIGAEPAQLSLVNESTGSDGTRIVLYEQRPFIYPLRGDYGKIQVRFTADGRVLSLTSTAIPESERIQAALKATLPRTTADKIPTKLAGQTLNYDDSAGRHSFTVAVNQISVQQLVIYPRPLSGLAPALELHLAWEINLNSAPVKVLYLDAVQEEVIAVSP